MDKARAEAGRLIASDAPAGTPAYLGSLEPGGGERTPERLQGATPATIPRSTTPIAPPPQRTLGNPRQARRPPRSRRGRDAGMTDPMAFVRCFRGLATTAPLRRRCDGLSRHFQRSSYYAWALLSKGNQLA
jgi:hypothetical protein